MFEEISPNISPINCLAFAHSYLLAQILLSPVGKKFEIIHFLSTDSGKQLLT
jgi:hypothetical protein